MKLTIYRIFYLISLSSLLGATIYSLVMTIISSLSYENKEECIIFSLCLIVLSIFILLQLYDIIRSFFKGGQIFNNAFIGVKFLLINFSTLAIINVIFIDFYLLVYKQDKIIRKV